MARSGAARVALCAAIALVTAACGIRVSSSDFPAFRLSEPEPAARPMAEAAAVATPRN
jgi:hypothetical protein